MKFSGAVFYCEIIKTPFMGDFTHLSSKLFVKIL